ncbi:MAG: SDR family NAD(P)-dependent oxidoreductase [Rhodospirillales bacterium]|nr:SDR family NAD(P)-dependent oxidoreductase [Rhodospirillales bacterium]
MTDLAGKVALVTGGSRGIGEAVARRFAGRGAQVIILHSSSPDDAQSVADSLPGPGHRQVQASVSDSAALAVVAENIRSTEGRLNYLINNAGWSTVIAHHELDELTDEIFDRIFATNVAGVFRCCRAFGPIIKESPDGGAIVNISSNAARTGMGSNIAYCASKLAVESMTQTLARVFCPEVRVLAVAPGMTLTPLAEMWGEEELSKRAQLNAMKRHATPDEMASGIVAAAADFTFSTGNVFLTDGGRWLF